MENTNEIWRDINGYDGLYQVSNQGRVKSLARTVERSNGRMQTFKERILKPSADSGGYLFVTLYKDGKVTNHTIHRLVANAFISNPNNYPQVNHRDENKTNNSVENLEWCTAEYNINYGSHNERMAKAKSKKVYQLDKTTGTVIAVFQSTNEVQRQLGFRISSISSCCNGKLKSAYNYKWSYSVPTRKAVQLAIDF